MVKWVYHGHITLNQPWIALNICPTWDVFQNLWDHVVLGFMPLPFLSQAFPLARNPGVPVEFLWNRHWAKRIDGNIRGKRRHFHSDEKTFPMLRKPDYNMRFIPFEIRNVWSTLMRLNVSGHLSQNLAGILCHSVDVFDARTRHFWAEPPQLLVDGCHILFISLLHQIYLGEWCFTSGGFAPPIPKKYVCRDQYKSRKEQVWLKISPWRRA